jgi:hypothetical protein
VNEATQIHSENYSADPYWRPKYAKLEIQLEVQINRAEIAEKRVHNLEISEKNVHNKLT